ncbi:MAG TPA: DUF1302 family protein [Myxococcota bacterium]|nr:DUF1302 family protein [Myxococcota bacterium]
MKRLECCLLLMLFAICPAALADMELNGVIATENYLGLKKAEFYNFRNANLLRLKIKAHPAKQVAALADIELRNTNFTAVQTISDLWDRGSVDPVSWRINQAYLDIYGFLFDSDAVTLDIRAGKQNIAWGEADGFNPTNNFDPYNLENPLDFKEHLGNVALKATFTIADELLTIEGVVAPRFLPAVLPVELFIGDDPLNNPLVPAIDPQMLALLESLNTDLVGPDNDAIRTLAPGWNAGNIMAGARIKWLLFDIDMSLSYFHGRDSIPVLGGSLGEFASSADQGCPIEGRGCLIITGVDLVFPKMDVLGFDFRADVWGIGVWGEAGLFFPQGLTAITTVAGGEMARIKVIDDQPFTKWTLGAEYTFTGGWYLNLQWVHGFFTEHSGHDLHDYLFAVFRKSLLSERLKFELTLGGELDTTRGRDGLAGLLEATVSYQPFDGAEVLLGYIMTRGEGGTGLDMFEPLDQVFLKFTAEF